MQNELRVSCLYQAAYLVASGCEFPRVTFDRTGAKFIFPDADGLVSWHAEAYKLDHGTGDEVLLMPVKKFIGAVRHLKRVMNAARQGKGNETTQKTSNPRAS